MSHKTDEIDGLVLNVIPKNPETISIRELTERWSFRLGTVRGSLERLFKDGYVLRKWDGNQRFGKYLYSRGAHEING